MVGRASQHFLLPGLSITRSDPLPVAGTHINPLTQLCMYKHTHLQNKHTHTHTHTHTHRHTHAYPRTNTHTNTHTHMSNVAVNKLFNVKGLVRSYY